MTQCHDMKVGEIYTCPECGLELQVVKSCGEAGEEACGCHTESGESCGIACCGQELTRKE